MKKTRFLPALLAIGLELELGLLSSRNWPNAQRVCQTRRLTRTTKRREYPYVSLPVSVIGLL